MVNRFVFLLLLVAPIVARAESGSKFDKVAAQRFANLALACVQKEYPNKINHTLNTDADVAPPRQLTPSFYGCYDWHSSVHGHWLLVRLLRSFPAAAFEQSARVALSISLTGDNVRKEAEYLRGKGRAAFERPYGLAWLLQLCGELKEWADREGAGWAANLRPLERASLEHLQGWLPKLSHPVRTGEHAQTAFALGLLLDYARITKNSEFAELLATRAEKFFLHDKACPLNYEPSGEDFLSPCLAEADVMRRVLGSAQFATWLKEFLRQIPKKYEKAWLPIAMSLDPSDPMLAHLDGLNLSRAWMLEGIVSGLPASDLRRAPLIATVEAHRRAGIAAVTGEHYEGGHWLGSFAVYLETQRGLVKPAL
jgi:hypothetical protein